MRRRYTWKVNLDLIHIPRQTLGNLVMCTGDYLDLKRKIRFLTRKRIPSASVTLKEEAHMFVILFIPIIGLSTWWIFLWSRGRNACILSSRFTFVVVEIIMVARRQSTCVVGIHHFREEAITECANSLKSMAPDRSQNTTLPAKNLISGRFTWNAVWTD